MRRLRLLGMIMAGGKGERLFPLTKSRSKPAVPFAGKHRIVDFVLSNFINSGIFSVYILVQYKSQSLIEHLRSTWRWRIGGGLKETFITVVPPQMRWGRRLVPGHGRRGVSKPQFDSGFSSRPDRRVRGRSHLSHGPQPDGRLSHRARGRGDGRSPARAGVRGRQLWG